MSIVGALLLPGSPLPLLRPENPPWQPLVEGLQRAGEIAASWSPDVIAVYSTQWIAVLDQLWQTRALVEGVHVDETWHALGDLPFRLRVDTPFAEACLERAGEAGIRSRAVDYDAFPIDTGTLVASHFLDPDGSCAFVMTSNNLYHDGPLTRRIGEVVRASAEATGRRVVAVGVGGLSGSLFREALDFSEDRIAVAEEDAWNRRVLELLTAGKLEELEALWPTYTAEARVDMGGKHLDFVLGALGGRYEGAELLGYGPTYGAGAAALAFTSTGSGTR